MYAMQYRSYMTEFSTRFDRMCCCLMIDTNRLLKRGLKKIAFFVIRVDHDHYYEKNKNTD
jgi:hypothetical protein